MTSETHTATPVASSPSRAESSPPLRSLPPTLRLGVVELTVSDLDLAVGFYEALGLRVARGGGGVAARGAGGEELLILHGQPGARRAGRHAGLYHVALLHSS